MNEQYLPVRKSVGYRNLKRALERVFFIDLDMCFIQAGEYEDFSFQLHYGQYNVILAIVSTGKGVQFEFGEGGKLSIYFVNFKDEPLSLLFLYELLESEQERREVKHVFGKEEKQVEYTLKVLKKFLESDNAKKILNCNNKLDTLH